MILNQLKTRRQWGMGVIFKGVLVFPRPNTILIELGSSSTDGR